MKTINEFKNQVIALQQNEINNEWILNPLGISLISVILSSSYSPIFLGAPAFDTEHNSFLILVYVEILLVYWFMFHSFELWEHALWNLP